MESPLASPAALPPASILLVDDYPPNLVALEAVLQPLGQRLVRAASGPEALGCLLREDFACVLLDVQMPGMDGFETARLIKERPRTRSLPLLFLTGVHREQASVLRGYAHGAVDYILKPYDPDVLRTKVAVFVDLFQQSQLLRQGRALRADPEREVMEREAQARLQPALDELQRSLHRELGPLPLVDAMVSAAPVGMAVLSPELQYLRINDTLARLHGTTVEAALGRTVHEVAPDLAERVARRVGDVLAKGEPALGIAFTREQAPGVRRHYLASYYPLAAAGVRGVGVVSTDVTALKEAEEAERASEERLRLHLDGVKEYAIFMMSPEGIVQSWNPGVERVKGYREEEFLGLPFARFFTPEQVAAGLPEHELQEAARTGVYEGEGTRLRKDGTRFEAEVVLRALRGPDGQLRGYVKVARDITERKRTEARLQQSEERLRAVLASLAEGILVQDVQGVLRLVNASAERILGVPEAELVGRTSADPRWGAVREDGSPLPAEQHPPMVALRTGRTVTDFRTGIRRADGTLGWFSVSAQPLFGADGRTIVGVVTSLFDITQRREAERALAAQSHLTRTLADNVTTALFMMDAQGHPTYMNPAAEQLTGYTLEEIRDRSLHDAIHHHHPDGRPYPKSECPIDRALPQNNLMRAHEDVLVRKDGRFFPALVAAAPIREGQGEDGVPVGTVVEVRDVTVQRQQEAERARLLEEAQAAVRLRDEFLSVASHELKTPLTPLHLKLAALQRAAESRRELAPERVEADVAVAQRQVRKLAVLIDDLLDVSRLTQGRLTLDPAPVDLDALAREVVAGLSAEAAWSGCLVSIESPGALVGAWDPVRLEQVLTNLLTNALKYGAGQPVQVRLAREGEGAGARVRLSVQDRGIGIEQEALPRVFGKFVRAVSERHYGGLGLGLYITRQIVEAHGGQVSVESRPHEGALFTVLLPLAIPAAGATPAAGTPGALP